MVGLVNMSFEVIMEAMTRLEQFALGFGHKITTNYFNNESIKKQKTVRVNGFTLFLDNLTMIIQKSSTLYEDLTKRS